MSSFLGDVASGIVSVVGSVVKGAIVGAKIIGSASTTSIIHVSSPSSNLLQVLSSTPNINSQSLALLNDMLFYSQLTSPPYTPSSNNKITMVNLEAMSAENLSNEYAKNLNIIMTLLNEQQQAYSKIIANPKSKPNDAEIALLKNRNLAIEGLTQRNKNLIAHCKNKYSADNVETYCKRIMQDKPNNYEKLIEIEKKAQKISAALMQSAAKNNEPKSTISIAFAKNAVAYTQLPDSIKQSLQSPLKPPVSVPPTQAPAQSTQVQQLMALEGNSAAARSQPRGSDKSNMLRDYQAKNTPTNSVSTKTEITQQQIHIFTESIRNTCPSVQVYKKENTIALTAQSGNELCKAAGEFSKQYNPSNSFKLESPNLKMALEVLTAAEKNHLIITAVNYQDEQGKTVTVEGKAVQDLLKNKGSAPIPAKPEVTISHTPKPK